MSKLNKLVFLKSELYIEIMQKVSLAFFHSIQNRLHSLIITQTIKSQTFKPINHQTKDIRRLYAQYNFFGKRHSQ